MNPTSTLALFGSLGTMELLVILGIGLLIFGRRLPEVGRGLGRSIVEFRKGLNGIEQEIDDASRKPQVTAKESIARAPLVEGGQDVRVSRAPSEHLPVASQPEPNA